MFSVMFHRYRLYTHTFCVVFRSSFTTPICNVLYMLWSCFCVCTSVVVFTLGCLYIEPVNALLSVFLALHHTWGCIYLAEGSLPPLASCDLGYATTNFERRPKQISSHALLYWLAAGNLWRETPWTERSSGSLEGKLAVCNVRELKWYCMWSEWSVNLCSWGVHAWIY